MPSPLAPTPLPARSGPQPVYAAGDVAKALDLSESYVRALVSRGVAVPTVPVGSGRRRLFSLHDVEALAVRLDRPLTPLRLLPDRDDTPPASVELPPCPRCGSREVELAVADRAPRMVR